MRINVIRYELLTSSLRHSLRVLFPTVSSVFIATKLFHQVFSEKRKRKASHPSNATQRHATPRNATQRVLIRSRSFDSILIMIIMIMNLYSAFSILISSNALYKQVIYGERPDHNTGNYVPYSVSRQGNTVDRLGDSFL